MKFEQIVIHRDQYGPENEIEGVLNFQAEDILYYNTPPRSGWSESTKSVFTYLRLRTAPKAFLVKYNDLKTIIEKYEK